MLDSVEVVGGRGSVVGDPVVMGVEEGVRGWRVLGGAETRSKLDLVDQLEDVRQNLRTQCGTSPGVVCTLVVAAWVTGGGVEVPGGADTKTDL